MLLGWRPHDIPTSYLPFFHGVGAQVGLTDPAYMAKFGLEPYPEDDHPPHPYDPVRLEELIQRGDKDAAQRAMLGKNWIGETTSGTFRKWEELAFLKQHWDGPLVLKGIMRPQVGAPRSHAPLARADSAIGCGARHRLWRGRHRGVQPR